MAKKYLDPILHTAHIIANDINLSALTYYKRSPHDKTFSAVIFGVDRKFTDTVSEGDRSDIVEKFGIPETTENGESKYYTFRINGAYYVKRSAFPFKLYDEIKVRVPNGSWSDMFIENGVKDDAFVPAVYVSDTEPTEEEYALSIGDYWIEITGEDDINAKAVYKYAVSEEDEAVKEWECIARFSGTGFIVSASEPQAGMSVGDIWLKINDDTEKKALAFYEYSSTQSDGEWSLIANVPTGQGVGENIGLHNERFNDYENNSFSGSGDYNHIGGADNSLSNASYMTVGGKDNTVLGSNNRSSVICGEENTAAAKTHNLGNIWHSVIAGYQNETAALSGTTEETPAIGIQNSFIAGHGNRLFSSDDNVVVGQANYIHAECSVICGINHQAVWLDDINGKEETLINGIMCGQRNIGIHDGIVCGQGNTGNDNYFLNVGIETASSGRRDGLGVDKDGDLYIAGTLYQQGADYAECFEWLDGNPENEDRRGMLVTLDGDRIIPANGEDIFGIVSAAPTVCANSASLEWNGRFKRDVFGAIIYDENNEPVLNPDYIKDVKYLSRTKRREWAAVGIIGRLIVRDNGTCISKKYCKALNGIAVGSEEKTSVRVLKRIDESHVEVFIK